MPKTIIASGAVIIENGKVLLVQHGDTEFWKFCGGKVEDFEQDLISTARREAKEEMGIGIKIINADPFVLYTRKKADGGDCDILLVHYLSRRIGEIVPGSDIRKWQWLPLDELANENLAPNILPTLRHFGFIK